MPEPQCLIVTDSIRIPMDEISLQAIRAQGAGGQHVNKVSTAIHLRFDIRASSLPQLLKHRLLRASDRRITRDGEIVIKAQSHRSQDLNRQDACERLAALLRQYSHTPKTRIATRPTLAAKRRRLDSKKKQAMLKKQRSRVPPSE